jgi:hypothetical protein
MSNLVSTLAQVRCCHLPELRRVPDVLHLSMITFGFAPARARSLFRLATAGFACSLGAHARARLATLALVRSLGAHVVLVFRRSRSCASLGAHGVRYLPTHTFRACLPGVRSRARLATLANRVHVR